MTFSKIVIILYFLYRQEGTTGLIEMFNERDGRLRREIYAQQSWCVARQLDKKALKYVRTIV